jgi:hypothetical protein
MLIYPVKILTRYKVVLVSSIAAHTDVESNLQSYTLFFDYIVDLRNGVIMPARHVHRRKRKVNFVSLQFMPGLYESAI